MTELRVLQAALVVRGGQGEEGIFPTGDLEH
jgi:hypothetical protein